MSKIYREAEIESLASSFSQSTLSKSEWTHEAHLIVAIWHLKKYDYYDGVCRLRSGIILLNRFHQTENTGNSGYHETLTIFWSVIIAVYIRLQKGKSTERLVNDFLLSSLADRTLPFQFYEKQKLLTPDCRAVYTAPYLKSINEQVIEKILSGNRSN